MAHLAAPLSIAERWALSNTMSQLMPAQLETLLFALNPPRGLVPPPLAAPAERVAALLEWAEGPSGCGLAEVHKWLAVALAPNSDTDARSPVGQEITRDVHLVAENLSAVVQSPEGDLRRTYTRFVEPTFAHLSTINDDYLRMFTQVLARVKLGQLKGALELLEQKQ